MNNALSLATELLRLPHENERQYLWRIGAYVDTGKYTWREITPIINREWRQDELKYRDESAYRKKYQEDCGFYRDVVLQMDNNVAIKILALSDFHFPFSLPVETFNKYAGKIDCLILNGDILDCNSISKYNKLYRIPLIEELIGAREYVISLINLIKPKDVYFTVGNHEKRVGAYLSKQMNELADLMPDNALDYIVEDGFNYIDKLKHTKVWYEPLINVFADTAITIHYDSNWYCKVGKSIFAHPLAYSSGMLKTTEKAVNYFYRIEKDFDTIVLSHTHMLGSFIQGNVHMYEQGTCSQTEKLNSMEGRLTNPQQKGFLYLCQDKDGNIVSDKTKLICVD